MRMCTWTPIKRSALLILKSMVFAGSLLAQDLPEGLKLLSSQEGVEAYELEANGLKVLLMPNEQLPVAAVMVTYNVGGRHEVAGTTGATHILEHMMFKGTHTFSEDQSYSKTMERIGARSNATTYYDRTNYYAVLPQEYVTLAIELEADRMRNLRIREEDLASEMTVVRNEYERGENNPVRTLIKEIYATAFMAHPYGHPVIGWLSDIETTSPEKLRAFYNTYYWPENTTLTIIGGYDRAETLQAIKQFYGSIPRASSPIPEISTQEPDQLGERRLTIERVGEVGAVAIAHKVPEGTHSDWAALKLLEQILGADKTGRLYRALDDKGKASSTFSFAPQLRDPSLFFLGAFLTPDSSHAEVEKIILQEIDNLISGGISEDELKQAKSVIEAEVVYGRDGPYAIASAINECIALGDWTTYLTLPKAIQKVNSLEVQRVARDYLKSHKRTTGYYEAKSPKGPLLSSLPGPNYFRDPEIYGQNSAPEDSSLSKATGAEPSKKSSVQFSPQIQEADIGPIRLVAIDMPIDKVVSFVGSFAAGDAQNPAENPLLASMTASMLDQGTERSDRFALAESLNSLGASIAFKSDDHSLQFSGKFLRNTAGFVIDILAEQLRQPAFDPEVFDNLKERTRASILQARHNPDFRADNALKRALYPPSHPNYKASVEDYLKALDALTIEDLKAFHARTYGPESMTLVCAGDIDFAQLSAAIATAFADWNGGLPYPDAIPETQLNPLDPIRITIPDKTSVSYRLGYCTDLRRTDPDYLPFALGNYILGGSFHSRLMSTIRVQEGLTYSIRSSHSGDILTKGHWSLSASFSPELLEKGKKATQSVIEDWHENGVTADEVEAARVSLKGKYLVGLSTTSAVAGQVHSFLQRGYPVDYIDRYPQKLDQITAESVNAIIREHLEPSAFHSVMAGSLP